MNAIQEGTNNKLLVKQTSRGMFAINREKLPPFSFALLGHTAPSWLDNVCEHQRLQYFNVSAHACPLSLLLHCHFIARVTPVHRGGTRDKPPHDGPQTTEEQNNNPPKSVTKTWYVQYVLCTIRTTRTLSDGFTSIPLCFTLVCVLIRGQEEDSCSVNQGKAATRRKPSTLGSFGVESVICCIWDGTKAPQYLTLWSASHGASWLKGSSTKKCSIA